MSVRALDEFNAETTTAFVFFKPVDSPQECAANGLDVGVHVVKMLETYGAQVLRVCNEAD